MDRRIDEEVFASLAMGVATTARRGAEPTGLDQRISRRFHVDRYLQRWYSAVALNVTGVDSIGALLPDMTGERSGVPLDFG